MFTGLTNQMSTWISKKGEDAGGELPAEEKFVTSVEGDDLNRKDSPSRSMLGGVKSQMTGWFSSVPRLSRNANHGNDADSQQAAGKAVNGAQVAQNTENTAEPIKDDDASSATGGADSGPGSLEGSPSEDKEGQQAFSGGERISNFSLFSFLLLLASRTSTTMATR
ncbi:hypothetical protein K0M31_017820 [Melipona bicolor]|uniref:Uncharacterized protein n=1 Tax=Melipona bicolor TaxID=60889 RepID=A0AA40G631_9HYME|nr:hypothetical protein K0M31_017820 [Melipona bicolor]